MATVSRAKTTRAAALGIALLVCLLAAGGAKALVVRLPNGQVIGVTPRAGVSPASIAGVRTSGAQPQADTGTVTYGHGPVMHSSAPYLVYWVPPGYSIPVSTQTLLNQYFTDTAHDSGAATNVYGVLRQYWDASGFADYEQAFSGAQVITDTQPYPTRDTTNCPDVNATYYPTCVTDAQLQQELTHFIAANGLPTDGAASPPSLVPNAPIYFIVTPVNVNLCFDSSACADNVFCAYHGSYPDGPSNVLYASIPLLEAESADPTQNPKNCQSDGNGLIQEPNMSAGSADVAIKYMSHEFAETITDPVNGSGWVDPLSGNEVGDNCNQYGSSANPAAGSNPNAFLPTLGGSASAMTLYNQLINGHKYYTQSEWSNGDTACKMQPTAATLTASFTTPSGSPAVNTPVSFNGTATVAAAGFSSVTWDFGDGRSAFATGASPGTASHTYTAPGTYTVTLTVVDDKGNLASVSHSVTIGASAPTAAFSAVTSPAVAGAPVTFDGTASSDPNAGGSISSYSWSFGDGATGTGPTPSHTYASPGPEMVTLTVTDAFGLSSTTTSKHITVYAPVTSTFSFAPLSPVSVGSPVSFDGTASSDANPGATISSYSWSFGDGGTAASARTTHAFTSPGVYSVQLRVTDNLGVSSTKTEQIEAIGPPTAAFTSTPAIRGRPVAFAAAPSSDPNVGGSIRTYTWSFGDGGSGSGASPSHTYAVARAYTVKLTVTDSFGLSAGTSRVVTVAAPGKPTAGGTSLTGLGQGHPRLTLRLAAGRGAPKLERIVIRLPRGLSFSTRGVAKGVRVSGASGFTDKLSRGTLTITLKRPARGLRITIAPPAITASRALERRLARHKLKTLAISVTAVDSSGVRTKLTLRLRV